MTFGAAQGQGHPRRRTSTSWAAAPLIRSLSAHGLIDEYLLSIHPIVLGHGHRLFDDGFPPAAFDLTRTATTATGVIIATFRSNPPEPVR